MSWIHTRWNSLFATIFLLYLTSGTNGQGSANFSSATIESSSTLLSIDSSPNTNLALTSTPIALSDMPPHQEGSALIYIGSVVGVAVMVTATVMLICSFCLYCKRKKRTLQSNGIKGNDSNGNMEPQTLQCYHEDKYEWKEFELADPETTSFGVPSNINSRAPSSERESLEYEEILPENFNPPHIINLSTANKSITFPQVHIAGLLPKVQGMDSINVSPGIKQATSMSALCQQKQYEAKPSAPVPYHQHLSSLPKHTVSGFATQYYSMKDLPGAALHEQHGPYQAKPKGESLYDIPRATLEASATETTRSYQGDTSGEGDRVNTQLYYDVPKQVVVAMREKTSVQLQENDTEPMQLKPFLWNTSEVLQRPVPIPASIPKPFQLNSIATNFHAPAMSKVSTTDFTTDTCSTYDVPKQVQPNTEQECTTETKLPSTSKSHEPASVSEYGSEDAYLGGNNTCDIPVLTVATSEPTTYTDADHYDIPKRLIANQLLTQQQSSLPKTPAAWIPHVHLNAPKLIEFNQNDMGIYDMPKHSTPQRIGDEVDSVDQHIYDLPPTEMIQELRQKRANNHGCSYQPPSTTEDSGSHVRYEAEPLDKDTQFTDRLLEGKKKSPYNMMATSIKQNPSFDSERLPLQELAMRNLEEEVDTLGNYHMGTKKL